MSHIHDRFLTGFLNPTLRLNRTHSVEFGIYSMHSIPYRYRYSISTGSWFQPTITNSHCLRCVGYCCYWRCSASPGVIPQTSVGTRTVLVLHFHMYCTLMLHYSLSQYCMTSATDDLCCTRCLQTKHYSEEDSQ